MINQYEQESSGGISSNSVFQLIQIGLLVALVVIVLFKSSSVSVNSTPAIVNVSVTPENNFNPSFTHNITIVNNMTGFGNWTGYNGTFNQTNYFGNYTINNTYNNFTTINYTYNNFTLNESKWLLNTSNLQICNVTDSVSNLTFRTWCWI